MGRARILFLLCILPSFLHGANLPAQEKTPFTRQEDVVYGRKFGTALTLDVFKPKEKANGLGLIFVVSGGWFSAHEAINLGFVQPFLNRGYTVFAVVHGSQPRFTIPEVVQDMQRSVRFIRTHAKEYGIDPDRIGVFGGSAGGHLSLMMGTTGKDKNPGAKDPIDQASSRVQAVACFFPPTDFLNYGHDGVDALGRGILVNFKAPFDFQELDKSRNVFVPIVDEAERRKIGEMISPANHVSSDDAPSLIVHGDADKLVPIQQAELILKKFEAAKVPARLIVKPGQAHGWPNIAQDLEAFADWFDKHLRPSKSSN
ncbi:MAG: alpha/beta hydrolase [Isosphaeraceae bacterium]